jgi:hypothetical protein
MFGKATTMAGEGPATAQGGADRDGRFFVTLLLGAGIAAGALVGFDVMWDDTHLSSPIVQQIELLTPPAP